MGKKTDKPGDLSPADNLATTNSAGKKLLRCLIGWPAVVILLAAFWFLAASSVRDKSNTYDEPAHITAGYTYWYLQDYRFNPANIPLSQMIGAFPLLFTHPHFVLDQNSWKEGANIYMWVAGFQFFYLLGNDVQSLLWRCRAMMALVGCCTGLVVYLLSKRLFGRVGGLISLTLYAFCPPLLAYSSLVITDMVAALTFLLATWCFWNSLNKVTVWTVLAAGASIAALLLTKMTGVFIVLIAIGLVIVRLAVKKPLNVKLVRTWTVESRFKQAGVFLASIVAQILIIFVLIWAVFGFRYSAYNPQQGDYADREERWEKALNQPGFITDCFSFAKDHHLLPEAYILYLAGIQGEVQTRNAFLNGQYSYYGWRTYYPYAFMVKTPLTLLTVVVLAAVAAAIKWRQAGSGKGGNWKSPAKKALYETAPFWILLVVYWASAISSHLDIGLRLILPVYPPMLILAGGAGYWLSEKSKAVKALLIVALIALAAETVYRWPNYISYFNQLIGGPANGYKHLVDSSLDWGQDLPSLKRWLDEQGLSNQTRTPVYLCYFGTASPTYFGIRAMRLYGYVDRDLPGPQLPPLVGGYYCISATMLQSVTLDQGTGVGTWTMEQEQMYQAITTSVAPLLRMEPSKLLEMQQKEPSKLMEMLRSQGDASYQYQSMAFNIIILREKRLMAYLRKRQPLHIVNDTILIYRISDQEAAEALTGPPPELRTDIPRRGLR